MEKIPSFTVNHEQLQRGVYVSRKDRVGDEIVTTFDVRMKLPNREPALHNGAIHTIEHLAATFLRNDAEWKTRIITRLFVQSTERYIICRTPNGENELCIGVRWAV
mgnify:CR=1 FL=1